MNARTEFQVIVGQDGKIDWGESFTQFLLDSNSKRYPAYMTPITGWLGLQIGGAYSVGRLANVGTAANTTLTDAMTRTTRMWRWGLPVPGTGRAGGAWARINRRTSCRRNVCENCRLRPEYGFSPRHQIAPLSRAQLPRNVQAGNEQTVGVPELLSPRLIREKQQAIQGPRPGLRCSGTPGDIVPAYLMLCRIFLSHEFHPAFIHLVSSP